MTQPRSTITLNRLVVMDGTNTAYDQDFHNGVNIISSDGNSTGKSTIMDFIFFVLGGDIEEWTEEALACDCVIAEITFRNMRTTLKREIGDSRYPPIYIYEGAYGDAIENSLEWLRFSHKRSKDRESFSQAFFRLLGYPENKLSSYANITIHELLRLVYCDQLTSVNHIFKHQNFDSDEMRLTVGEFLLGVDDLDLHGLRLQLRENEKEISNLAGRLKATKEILIAADIPPDIDEISNRIKGYENKRNDLRKHIDQLESPIHKERQVEETVDVKNVRKELSAVKLDLKQQLDSKELLTYEIEDSVLFINSIKERLGSLSESEITRETLGELKFEFCPACLSKIEVNDQHEPTCHLCKKNQSDEFDKTGFLRMQFELNYQVKESEQLLDLKKHEIKRLNLSIEELFDKRRQLQERYNSFVITADPIAAELKDSLTRLGSYDNKIENLREKSKLVGTIEEISLKKSEIAGNISRLNDQIATKKEKRKRRLQVLKKRISEITVGILQDDIPSEESFAHATDFEFDFAKNRLLVDGRSKFSASSICYLKSAFFFALLLISIEDEQVLYPRFLLLDNIEDKGSTPARVQNMHGLIINSLKKIQSSHQVIFTTSVLAEDLKESEYCVGPEYNYNLKTLSI